MSTEYLQNVCRISAECLSNVCQISDNICKKPKKNVPSILSSENGLISGKHEMAELLDNHFVTVSSKVLNNNERENVVYNVPKKLKQFVTINQPVNNYFLFLM